MVVNSRASLLWRRGGFFLKAMFLLTGRGGEAAKERRSDFLGGEDRVSKFLDSDLLLYYPVMISASCESQT